MRAIRLITTIFGALVCVAATASDPEPEPVSYNATIRQILSNNCFECHGPDARARKGRPQLDTFATATKAWRSGQAPIVPGDPESSEILRRVTSDNPSYRMPPPEKGEALSAEEIASLRAWIAQGAEYEKHWSYMPPVRPEAPAVRKRGWPRNAIDHFVLARLEREGLEPSGEADKYTLVRRLYLDLIGLPPTPEEMRRWTRRRKVFVL